MKRALLDDAVFFNENWTIREGFDRHRIIDNAKRYFKKYGFYEEKYSNNYSTSDIGRLFYKIILTEFFPIIFDKEKDMKDDISDMYNRQVDRLKHLFAAPDLEELFYINAQNKDISVILDFCLNDNVDNADIAIPINTSSLNLGMVMPWKKNAVEIVTKPADNQFRAWSERSDLSLDELMEKWVEYPFDPEGLFVKPWNPWLDGFVEKSEQKIFCPITHTKIEYCYVLSHYIYFLTRKDVFSECSNYSEMKELIIKRLKDSLTYEYDGPIYTYYNSIINEIEEMLEIIWSMNFEQMIEHSEDDYKENVSHFNLEPDTVYTSCAFERDNTEDIIDAIYQLLEKSIYDFAIRIDDNCEELVKNLRENLPEISIERHKEKIGQYLTDEKFQGYISLIDAKLNENNAKFYTPRKNNTNKTMVGNLINYFSPGDNYLKCLKMALEKYYGFLQGESENTAIKTWIEENAQPVLADPEFICDTKKDIDTKIDGLREHLMIYLQTQYEIIMLLTGKDKKMNFSDFEEYDKIREKLICFKYALTPFYPFLFDIEKELKERINDGTEMGIEHFNTIIDSNLKKYKSKVYSDCHLDDWGQET